jgi:hypothetical protein
LWFAFGDIASMNFIIASSIGGGGGVSWAEARTVAAKSSPATSEEVFIGLFLNMLN